MTWDLIKYNWYKLSESAKIIIFCIVAIIAIFTSILTFVDYIIENNRKTNLAGMPYPPGTIVTHILTKKEGVLIECSKNLCDVSDGDKRFYWYKVELERR